MAFGTLAAVGLNRADFPGKGVILALLMGLIPAKAAYSRSLADGLVPRA